MSKIGKITRRGLLLGSAAVAGGVVFGYWKYRQPYGNPLLQDLQPGEATLTPYVLLDEKGVTIITPRAEMGQGIHTTLAAMVAEELDVDLASVNVIHGPASKAYYNGVVLEEGVPFAATDQSAMAENARAFTHIPAKFFGMQMTGGSSSTADGFHKMRIAGAAARQVLIEAAALKWGMSIDNLRADSGFIVSNDGRQIKYIDLVDIAANIEPPSEPVLKPESEWKILGKSQNRVDMLPKCTGTAEYSIDVQPEGLLYATVKMSPYFGGKIKQLDASVAKTLPGVKDIITLDHGVAVIATNTWYAFKAANTVEIEWEKASYPESVEGIFAKAEAAFEGTENSKLKDQGDVDTVLQSGQYLEGEYRVPFLAHATMEPMNATALLTDNRLDIWAGNQIPTQVLIEGERITGLPQEDIHVHTTYMGGGFGRRAEMDFIKQAIEIASHTKGVPVKLTWTREEDFSHDSYRPLAIARYRAQVDAEAGYSLDLKLAAPSVAASQFGRYGMPTAESDPTIVQATWDQPYAIDNYRVVGYRVEETIPVSSWRSVGASQNGFFQESIIDEMAHSAGIDPVKFRLDIMTDETCKAVLQQAAEMSGWGNALPRGRARGVAFTMSFGVPVAEVVEISMSQGQVKVEKVYAAVDVGKAMDPRNIEAQVISGINFGLSAAMFGEITLSEGKVSQSNFHDYPLLRLNQSPDIEVKILENGPKVRGIGEPGTPPVAPALANAIFNASGKRIRELPLAKSISFS